MKRGSIRRKFDIRGQVQDDSGGELSEGQLRKSWQTRISDLTKNKRALILSTHTHYYSKVSLDALKCFVMLQEFF